MGGLWVGGGWLVLLDVGWLVGGWWVVGGWLVLLDVGWLVGCRSGAAGLCEVLC